MKCNFAETTVVKSEKLETTLFGLTINKRYVHMHAPRALVSFTDPHVYLPCGGVA